MLPDTVADVLHFLTCRDLDKASGVSKWLDAMIATCCEVYPLRSLRTVELRPVKQGKETPTVSVQGVASSPADSSFGSVDDAVRFVGSVLRHSHVELLRVGEYYSQRMAIFPHHWASLIDAIRSGVVRHVELRCLDFRALGADAFLTVVGCRGIQSLVVRRSIVPGGFVTDDLICASVIKGLNALWLVDNKSDAPHRLSDDSILDFFFRAGEAQEGQSRSLELELTRVTDMFVAKFFERLELSTVRPSGSLKLGSAPKQRGLSAYARHPTPGVLRSTGAAYRFPSDDVNDKSFYEIVLYEGSNYMHMRFCQVCHSY